LGVAGETLAWQAAPNGQEGGFRMKKSNSLVLVIEDNGKGVDLQEAGKKDSLGLMGMRERALLFRGELTIDSQQQRGTKVTLKIPY